MRSDVLAHATARFHAGEITLAEWQACVAQFRRRPTRANQPPTPQQGQGAGSR